MKLTKEPTICLSCRAVPTHTCKPDNEYRCHAFVHREKASKEDLKRWKKEKKEQELKKQIALFWSNMPKWANWVAKEYDKLKKSYYWVGCKAKLELQPSPISVWIPSWDDNEADTFVIPKEYEPKWMTKVSIRNSLINRPR